MSPDREQVSDAAWEIAEGRSEIFRGIVTADNGRERSHLVARALEELSVSRATFYRLLARFRASEVTSALLPEQSGRKKGSQFLDARREAIIAREISSFYLKPERPRLIQLVEHVHALCHREGLPLPDWRTIRARVRQLDAGLVARRRQDPAAITATKAVPGELVTSRPLEIVQIDHTNVDVIVVEATSRMAMARPWLTLAIDVHTRMVVGAYLALHEPSAVSLACAYSMRSSRSRDFSMLARSIFPGRRWACLRPSSSTMVRIFEAGPLVAAAVNTALRWIGGRPAHLIMVGTSSD